MRVCEIRRSAYIYMMGEDFLPTIGLPGLQCPVNNSDVRMVIKEDAPVSVSPRGTRWLTAW